MRITAEEVRITARMARLRLEEAEVERMTIELGRILDYVASLEQVDTTGVAPLDHPGVLTCPLRPDEVGAHLPQREALRNAPLVEQEHFAVPAILVGLSAARGEG